MVGTEIGGGFCGPGGPILIWTGPSGSQVRWSEAGSIWSGPLRGEFRNTVVVENDEQNDLEVFMRFEETSFGAIAIVVVMCVAAHPSMLDNIWEI